MRSAEGRRGETVPFRVIPARGQASEYLPEKLSRPSSGRSHSKESCHVLHEDVAGSNVANDSEHLSPENSFRVPESLASAGHGDSLAGESSGDEVDGLGVGGDVSDVVVNRDSWKPKLEEPSSERVDLAQPSVLEPCEVESVGEESTSIE